MEKVWYPQSKNKLWDTNFAKSSTTHMYFHNFLYTWILHAFTWCWSGGSYMRVIIGGEVNIQIQTSTPPSICSHAIRVKSTHTENLFYTNTIKSWMPSNQYQRFWSSNQYQQDEACHPPMCIPVVMKIYLYAVEGNFQINKFVSSPCCKLEVGEVWD